MKHFYKPLLLLLTILKLLKFQLEQKDYCCCHFLHRRRHRLDNASRKLRSSKLVLRVGAVLYALGFGAE